MKTKLTMLGINPKCEATNRKVLTSEIILKNGTFTLFAFLIHLKPEAKWHADLNNIEI